MSIAVSELSFNLRMGDYALEACPKRLARISDSEQNETIDFVKYYREDGIERKYSIGYFWYNDYEERWELKFVGNRFLSIEEEEIRTVWEMLKSAYSTVNSWKNRREIEGGTCWKESK